MPSRSSAAAIAILPSIAATYLRLVSRFPAPLFLRRRSLNPGHVRPAEGTCAQFLELRPSGCILRLGFMDIGSWAFTDAPRGQQNSAAPVA
jgi:hypothetical protein